MSPVLKPPNLWMEAYDGAVFKQQQIRYDHMAARQPAPTPWAQWRQPALPWQERTADPVEPEDQWEEQ